MSGHEQISEVGEVIVSGGATEAKQDVQIAQGIVIEGNQDTQTAHLIVIEGKQDTTNSNLVTIQGKQDTTNTKIDSTNTKLDTIDTDIKAEQPRTITQNVKTSTSNEKTTNIGGNETWYGLGESTLGVAGIQVNFAASHDCEVEVQQSNDNVNWDARDAWIVPVEISLGKSVHGRTIQATGSYFRIKVTNRTASPTTHLRLSVALCPVVEALPRALTAEGNLKVCVRENVVSMVTGGGRQKTEIFSGEIWQILNLILVEMEIMNIHLGKMSGQHISQLERRTKRRMSL